MSINLTKAFRFERVINATASATTTISGTAVDTKGLGSVTFIVGLGVISANATPSIHIQESPTSTASDFVSLKGTSVSLATTNPNDIVAVEVIEPRKRFVRGQVVRAGAACKIDFGIMLQGRAKIEPVTHDAATVVSTEVHASPATGTP